MDKNHTQDSILEVLKAVTCVCNLLVCSRERTKEAQFASAIRGKKFLAHSIHHSCGYTRIEKIKPDNTRGTTKRGTIGHQSIHVNVTISVAGFVDFLTDTAVRVFAVGTD